MIRLALGGGNFHKEGWANIDYPFEARAHKQKIENIDIVHNFMDEKPIGLSDGCVDLVYTEHCIEHLPEKKVAYLLGDVFRLLKPGGVLRISCPDSSIAYDKYTDPNVERIDFNSRLRDDGKEIELLDFMATPLANTMTREEARGILLSNRSEKAFDIFTSRLGDLTKEDQERSPGGHLSWWDGRKLQFVLRVLGFRKVTLRDRNESGIEDFKDSCFDRTAPTFSVRVECAK
jgi:SAM-dependent methyltransferase